jgi:uncharacterized protein YkwD
MAVNAPVRHRFAIALAALLALGSSCVSSGPLETRLATLDPAAFRLDVAAPTASNGDPQRYRWQSETRSPRRPQTPQEAWLVQQCGEADAGLEEVARRIAERQVRGLPGLEMPEVEFALRASGLPYVWPRAWTVEGRSLAKGEVEARMQRWLETFHDGGQRRCGVARASHAGNEVLAAVALDALADLDPLPSHARAGEWLTVGARLSPEVSDAKVVVLGPRGVPRNVPSTFAGSVLRASFSVDQPGQWLIQVMASTAAGPRPVSEAVVHVDRAAPDVFVGGKAPGEDAAPEASAEDRLIAMVNGARAWEGLGAVRRDARLDALALEHARAMLDAGHIGHDVGDGDPRLRLERAELPVRTAGENVAHAADLVRAHRALWASPSHRSNLLHAGFRAIGVGVVQGPDGTVWVCQLFATFESR